MARLDLEPCGCNGSRQREHRKHRERHPPPWFPSPISPPLFPAVQSGGQSVLFFPAPRRLLPSLSFSLATCLPCSCSRHRGKGEGRKLTHTILGPDSRVSHQPPPFTVCVALFPRESVCLPSVCALEPAPPSTTTTSSSSSSTCWASTSLLSLPANLPGQPDTHVYVFPALQCKIWTSGERTAHCYIIIWVVLADREARNNFGRPPPTPLFPPPLSWLMLSHLLLMALPLKCFVRQSNFCASRGWQCAGQHVESIARWWRPSVTLGAWTRPLTCSHLIFLPKVIFSEDFFSV